ncbi:hypothetical protein REPUB_Repub16aG0129700 [Reevesia pubescens]
MDPVTGAGAKLSSEAAKGIFQEIKHHVRYVIIYKKNVEKFEQKLKLLIAKRTGLQQEVEAADRNGEKIKADVEHWRNTVDKVITEEEKKVKDLEDKAKNKCFIGLCPNIKSRYQLSRKAEEDATAFDELVGQCQFNGVGYHDVPEARVDAAPKDFEAFESREKVFKDIVEALKDTTISMIGVYGIGGVGKTTLVNEVARQVQEVKLFDSVVMVAVSHTPDILKIQDQVAESLGLKLEEKSIPVRASRLCERLKKEKKFLVILDDIWAKLDLKEVGIPFGDENKGCNLLLTSRDLNVLRDEMDARENFAIGVLDDEEAWDLFKKMAGDNVESLELRSTAIELAKKCAGLPVAIVTVAKALRNKNIYAWNDALRKLQRPSPTNFTGIPSYVYSAIELSYNHLESEELKQTFLLCALLGQNVAIQDLLKYTMGLGLFQGVNTVEETRDRLLTVVSDLKASCLLHDSYSNKLVYMHDLICDVALAIASRDNNVFALKPEYVPKDWSDGETIEKYTMISLRYANISHFPKELKCPQLTFFYVASKDSSMEIPSSFFKEMKNLKVLDLTNMHFSSLPSSISLLTNLRTLCLDQCVLGDIHLIGELKNLEVLSLLSSDIEILPKEIGQLIKLKLLDLSNSTKLKIIPPGLLSSLSRLEELLMANSFVHWEVEGHANASLAELKALSCLTTLDVQIPHAEIMPKDLFSENLKKYKIFIGGQETDWVARNDCSRTLCLKLNTSIHHLDYGVKVLLKETEALYIKDVKGFKILLDALSDGEGLLHLKNLHIQNGSEMQYIINDGDLDFLQLRSLTLQDLPELISFCSENKWGSTSTSQHELSLFNRKMVFPCLENLHLSSINVERIWHNGISNISEYYTQNLTSLIIEGCDNLKYLLSSSTARSLAHLKCFEIVECKCLREVIFTEDIEEENKATITFPQLNSLKIRNLQHLTGFCSENYNIEFPSLKFLAIEQCPQLRGFIYKSTMEENQHFSPEAFFVEKVAFPSLESLSISSLRNVKMIWHNQLSVNSFCKLGKMVVEHCNELFSIFPFGMLSTIQRLQTLKVSNCCSVEHIFEVQRSNMEETLVVVTQLRELYIQNLPKLKNVWNNDPQGILSFQNLSVVFVWSCWSLKNVFPASVARVLPQLKELTITSCAVEEIVSKAEGWETTAINFEFDQVSLLSLWNLPQLKCFYPGMHTKKWPMLKRLGTYHCNKVKILDTECLNLPDLKEDGQLESPIQPPLFLVEKVVSKLEEVFLTSDDIAIICDSKVSNGFFHEIKTLNLLCYHDESAIFPTTFLERFNNLEKLEVICCKFEDLFSNEGGVGKGTNPRTVLPIRNLGLNGLPHLKHIWMQGSQLDRILPNLETLEVFSCENLICLGLSLTPFQNLMTLDVWKCDTMINLVSSLAIQSLVQLENLKIKKCVSMKEIVGNEGDDEATYDVIFNKLKCLELRHLPSLKSFCSGNHAFGFPSLVQVIVRHCPELEIFCKGDLNAPILRRVRVNDKAEKGHWDGDLNITVQQLYTKKVDYEGMEYLTLSDFSKAIKIWRDNLQKTLDLKNLQHLEVYECNSLTYIFTTSMALDLVQLEKMVIKNCLMLEQIITNDGAEEATTNTIMFPSLQSITLESCSNFTSFYLGSLTVECPYLTNLCVKDCPKMVAFASSSPIEQNIKPIDIAPFFNDKVVFPRLNTLKIEGMGNLTRIWHDKITLNSFFEIQCIIVDHCERLLNIFPFNMMERLDKLKNLVIINCGSLEEIIRPHGHNSYESHEATTSQSIVAETIAKFVFPKIESLRLDELPTLKSFYSNMHTTEWPSLQILEVKGCNKVEIIFAGKHMNYQEMQGKNQLEIPIQQPLFWVNEVTFPCLEILRIMDMGNCGKIWPDQLVGDSFCKLKSLRVQCCHKLSNIFPFDMRGRLQNLENFQISECESLEVIFEPQELNANELHAVTTINFVFPEVTILQLHRLPKLKSFYSRIHTTEWPSLKKMWVYKCDKAETFASENLSSGGSTNQDPLFWVNEVTFPNLEELKLEWNDVMKEIWRGQLRAELFSKLKVLELIDFLDESVVFPHCFIQSLPNLEKLVVSNSSFNEIFHLEGIGGEKNHGMALISLHELRTLEVLECGKLKTLVQSAMSFENLTTLEVSRCHGLVSLIASSSVKSLKQLTRMSITECNMIEQIIACEDCEVKSGIVFTQLKYLQLSCLPSLASFCLGDHSFEFPLLEKVIVIGCPKMETFNLGDLSTKMLRKVQFTESEDEGCWEGSLNTTIQRMFVEKAGGYKPGHLKLFESYMLVELWRSNPRRILDLKSLKFLEVYDCSTLKYLFTLSMALDLAQLSKVEVKNCHLMEHIIAEEGTEEKFTENIIFPMLGSITLESCADLKSFYQGSRELEFPSLIKIKVVGCSQMSAFSEEQTIIETIDDGGNRKRLSQSAAAFFNNQVVFPRLNALQIEGMRNLTKIWHDKLTLDSFGEIQYIILKNCERLLNIFPFNMMERLDKLKHLVIRNCGSLEEIIGPHGLNSYESHEVTTSQLIVAEITAKFVFPKIESLLLENLPKLTSFYSKIHTTEWPSLQKLLVKECNEVEIIFVEEHLNHQEVQGKNQLEIPIQQPLFWVNEVAFPCLEILIIGDMKNCGKIWSDQLVGDSFCKLKSLKVYHCHKLSNIFPFNMRGRLHNLEDFQLIKCDSLEVIFEPQVLNANEAHAVTNTNFVFPEVTYLNFYMLPKLKSFYYGIHTTEWPSLKKMWVYRCDKVETFASKNLSSGGSSNQDTLFWVNEVTFPNLEELKLEWNGVMKEIWRGQLRAEFFSELKVLELIRFPDNSDVFPHCFIQSLPNLEKLVVSNASFSKIFHLEGIFDEENHGLTFTSLNELRTLEVLECGKLETLVLSAMSFENLTTLEISKCHGLVSLIASSSAKSLKQLTRMSITECNMIEQIIACEGCEVKAGIVFSQLKYMQLSCLPSLASFCLGDHSFEFPLLEKVIVIGCPKMEIFNQGDLSTKMLRNVQFTECEDEGCWEGSLNTTIQRLFKGKVGEYKPGHLKLSESSILKELWRRNPRGILDLRSLKFLEVYDCSTLKYLFTLSMALDLAQLNVVRVKNCHAMEHIIVEEGTKEKFTNKIIFSKLHLISLESCANLKCFYQGSRVLEFPSLLGIIVHCPQMSAFSEEQRIETIDDGENRKRLSQAGAAAFFNNKVALPCIEILRIKDIENCGKIWSDQLVGDSFCKLKYLWVYRCHKLSNIFPFGMRGRLQNLEDFQLMECDSLEVIFESQELNTNELHSVTTTNFVFPEVTILQLYRLPKLKSFYSRIHTTEWPSLKIMWLYRCDKVQIFASSNLSSGESTNQDPLLANEVMFPNLEELKLEWNDEMKEIWRGPFRAELFSKLEVLELIRFPNEFPHCFIQLLPNLEKLVVSNTSFNEIFHFEGTADEENHGLAFTSVNELRTLEVLECGKLETLVPSAMLFENLTTLDVSRCHGLVSLIASSSAKSLKQLTKMNITECNMIEQIIACEGCEVEGGIVFTQLKYLQLSYLPSLASYCLGDLSFEFPILEKLIVIGCPKLEIFCQGDLSTPKLQKVLLTEDEDENEEKGLWQGNLKTVIEHLFKEMVFPNLEVHALRTQCVQVFPSLEDLELCLSIDIQRTWNYKLLAASSYAQNLTCLTVEGCHNLNCLFPSSMVKSFVQLKMLNIENCENMEKVIFIEELAIEEMMSKKLFHRLELLLLKHLPKLTRFCDGNYFEFPLLRILTIERCPTLKTFIFDAEGNSSEIASPILLNEKVAFPCLEELSIIGMGNWREILHDGSTNSVRIQFANC